MNTDRAVKAFYAVVLTTALGGSVAAAVNWLGVPWYVAALPIAAVELGGVVLMRLAQERRELGEQAIPARVLAFAVATFAVATNVFGHNGHVGLSAFFGGFSALGFAVYLLISAARRRDALRAAGRLEDAPPPYGMWQWLRHPGVTRRARLIAQTDRLGRLASLAAAREQVRAERREAAIAKALDGLIREAAGPVMADIAVHTYDTSRIAALIAEQADLPGYARLIASDLTPAKLAGAQADDLGALVEVVTPPAGQPVPLPVPVPQNPTGEHPVPVRPRWRQNSAVRRPRRMGRPQPQITVVLPEPAPARPAAKSESSAARPGRPSSAQKVASFAARFPEASIAELARKTRLSEDTIRRHLPKQTVAVNGHNHS